MDAACGKSQNQDSLKHRNRIEELILPTFYLSLPIHSAGSWPSLLKNFTEFSGNPIDVTFVAKIDNLVQWPGTTQEHRNLNNKLKHSIRPGTLLIDRLRLRDGAMHVTASQLNVEMSKVRDIFGNIRPLETIASLITKASVRTLLRLFCHLRQKVLHNIANGCHFPGVETTSLKLILFWSPPLIKMGDNHRNLTVVNCQHHHKWRSRAVRPAVAF